MMTLQQIKDALSDRSPMKVTKATGLHYQTIREVRDNPLANPTYKVLLALSNYLGGKNVQN